MERLAHYSGTNINTLSLSFTYTPTAPPVEARTRRYALYYVGCRSARLKHPAVIDPAETVVAGFTACVVMQSKTVKAKCTASAPRSSLPSSSRKLNINKVCVAHPAPKSRGCGAAPSDSSPHRDTSEVQLWNKHGVDQRQFEESAKGPEVYSGGFAARWSGRDDGDVKRNVRRRGGPI